MDKVDTGQLKKRLNRPHRPGIHSELHDLVDKMRKDFGETAKYGVGSFAYYLGMLKRVPNSTIYRWLAEIKDSPKLIWHADHPKRNLYPYYISKLISGKVKVVLGGIGADELFGGYSWKYVVSNLALDTRKNLDVSGMKNEVVESARKILQYQTRHGFIEDDRFLEYIKRLANIDNNTELYFIFKTLDEVYNNHYLNRIYHEDFFEKIQEPYDKIKKIYETYFNNNHSFVDQVLLTDYSVKLKDIDIKGIPKDKLVDITSRENHKFKKKHYKIKRFC